MLRGAFFRSGSIWMSRLGRTQSEFCRATVETRMKHDLIRFGLAITSALGLFAGKTPIGPAIFRCALRVIKLLGLFSLARYVTRDGLRIICYHGFAVAEEYKF